MIKWINKNKQSIIRNSFLIPILLVVIMSISHVVSWYELGNPLSWAIYLSIAIEIFALASVSASTLSGTKKAIWFLFGLVTAIQIVGNVFFEYEYINVEGKSFKAWLELISPIVDDWGVLDHKRLLALVQGGTLPIMSLTALHFFIKFNENRIKVEEEKKEEVKDEKPESIEEKKEEPSSVATEIVPPMSHLDFDLSSKPKEEVENREPTELELARNYWGKTKGSFEGVSESDIIDNYRRIKFKGDPNYRGGKKI